MVLPRDPAETGDWRFFGVECNGPAALTLRGSNVTNNAGPDHPLNCLFQKNFKLNSCSARLLGNSLPKCAYLGNLK